MSPDSWQALLYDHPIEAVSLVTSCQSNPRVAVYAVKDTDITSGETSYKYLYLCTLKKQRKMNVSAVIISHMYVTHQQLHDNNSIESFYAVVDSWSQSCSQGDRVCSAIKYAQTYWEEEYPKVIHPRVEELKVGFLQYV